MKAKYQALKGNNMQKKINKIKLVPLSEHLAMFHTHENID